MRLSRRQFLQVSAAVTAVLPLPKWAKRQTEAKPRDHTKGMITIPFFVGHPHPEKVYIPIAINEQD